MLVKKTSILLTGFLLDEFGGTKCAHHYAETNGEQVREMLLSPFKANRVDRRAKIDPNAVQPIGKCQRRKSERYAKNVAEKLRNVDQASSQATMEKQSKAFEFFKQRLALVMQCGVDAHLIWGHYKYYRLSQ